MVQCDIIIKTFMGGMNGLSNVQPTGSPDEFLAFLWVSKEERKEVDLGVPLGTGGVENLDAVPSGIGVHAKHRRFLC